MSKFFNSEQVQDNLQDIFNTYQEVAAMTAQLSTMSRQDRLDHIEDCKVLIDKQKTFSIFSLASNGRANLYILKKNFKNTKSGFWRKKGFKPTVRGVAMNPVDHPHGGRTNSIKYPRTPWGKTTKFK